jgi:DMSO/TMAO reductase YedYZ heme-binding membrane subunit
MTPLHTFLRWRSALPLRKPAGLWAFGFGLLHVAYYIDEAEWEWLKWPIPLYLTLGLLGLAVLTALAVTSNRWSMRRLGKNWKRLHRLVYLAGLAVVCHALLATTMSKKVMVYDPQAASELRVYLGLLVVLLVVRIPQVRRRLQQMMTAPQPQPRTVQPVTPAISPSRTPAHWPVLNQAQEEPGNLSTAQRLDRGQSGRHLFDQQLHGSLPLLSIIPIVGDHEQRAKAAGDGPDLLEPADALVHIAHDG